MAMKSILEKLAEQRVFSIEKQERGRFLFTENCDDHFSLELSSGEVLQLADELRALAIEEAEKRIGG